MNSLKRKEQLAEEVHNRLLALRNIETIMSQRDFQWLFDEASDKQREKAMDCVNAFDSSGLREWYKERRLSQLGILSVRELRTLASRLGVPNYNKLSKSMLLSEIARLQDARQGPTDSTDPCIVRRHEESDSAVRDCGSQIPSDIRDSGGFGNGTATAHGVAHVAH